MKQYIFTALILMITLPTSLLGQQNEKKPTWLNGYHLDLKNTYIDAFSAIAPTYEDARTKAIQNIIDERSRATGRRFSVKENAGELTLSSQDELTVKCRILDEYHRITSDGNREVFLLVQTARHPDFAYEPVEVSDHYPLSARALIPGLSQMHKGSTVKGWLMLGGVAAFGLGALFCENERADYRNKIKEQPQFAQSYNTKANNFETARNVCLGAAAAIWIYNIVDAATAKGARRIIVKPTKGSYVSLQPVASPSSVGISLSYIF